MDNVGELVKAMKMRDKEILKNAAAAAAAAAADADVNENEVVNADN